MPKKFSPIVPLLFITFLATSFVAIRTNDESKVLGDETENLTVSTEIDEVKAPDVSTTKSFQLINEKGKIKTTVQNRVLKLRQNLNQLNLKVKESSPLGERVREEIRDLMVKPVGDNELQLEDKEHVVRTNFPITINQEDDTISVTTPKGEVVVKDLPSTTVQNLIKNKVFTKVSDTWIRPSTQSGANAVLSVQGQTVKNFLGVFPVKSEVNAEVDPTTGEITKLSTPWFQNTFGFLFSK